MLAAGAPPTRRPPPTPARRAGDGRRPGCRPCWSCSSLVRRRGRRAPHDAATTTPTPDPSDADETRTTPQPRRPRPSAPSEPTPSETEDTTIRLDDGRLRRPATSTTSQRELPTSGCASDTAARSTTRATREADVDGVNPTGDLQPRATRSRSALLGPGRRRRPRATSPRRRSRRPRRPGRARRRLRRRPPTATPTPARQHLRRAAKARSLDEQPTADRWSAAATSSASCSAAAAWPRSARAPTPGSAGSSRSSGCAPTWPATRRSRPGSAARRSPPPRSTTPRSSRSTTPARSRPTDGTGVSQPYIVMEYVAGPHAARHPARGPQDPARAGARDHQRRALRARLQPPRGDHPPRHQARQRDAHPERRRQGDGLRHRPRDQRRRHHDDPDRGRRRHRPVPLPRAGPRRDRRLALRRLLRRLPALRAAHRPPAVRRRQPGRGRLPARPRARRCPRPTTTPTCRPRSTRS